jgi:hypothetical protein
MKLIASTFLSMMFVLAPLAQAGSVEVRAGAFQPTMGALSKTQSSGPCYPLKQCPPWPQVPPPEPAP